ncbi:origin recognition complex subunit 2-domain-containing protein [Lipomyces orientalis]|uniref:Origin recognition complex subunit 2-domain-containing protein n=1 Tax=Lipomyces orientalis TaxID=1233043 RepID=A0ACC3TZM8_9ASCO
MVSRTGSPVTSGNGSDYEDDGPQVTADLSDQERLSDDEQLGTVTQRSETDHIAEKLPVKAQGRGNSPIIILDGSDGYFDQHLTKPVLSTNSISKLPFLTSQEYSTYIQEAEQYYKSNRETLVQLHETLFAQWAFELSQGFNLVLYGLGSKRELALSFAQEYLDDVNVLVINGYNPSTTIREVVASSAAILLDDPNVKIPKAIPDILSLLFTAQERKPFPYDSYKPKLVLLIHDIDGEAFRNDRSQSALSRLAAHNQVSVFATVDHINTPILWDSAKLSSFNFIWHDATTFASYTAETSFSDPLMLGGGTGRNVNRANSGPGHAGIRYVLESLTSNARGLYRVLISHQLQSIEDDFGQTQDSRNDSSRFGMEFKTLYQRCSEEFIVTNELNFRTMLTEFYEHEMLNSTKDLVGTEVIYAPFDKEVLERLLEDDILNE